MAASSDEFAGAAGREYVPADDQALAGACSLVGAYYGERVACYGATPLGVDWSCLATQWLRFVQLMKLCDLAGPVSLNDVGCGYGALVAFLAERHSEARIDYLGVDILPTMVRRARRLHGARADRRFAVGDRSPRTADYTVASGVMNVKLGHPRELWISVIARILQDMHRTSRRGFAVNFLAQTPTEVADEQLYRTSPEPWIRYCRRELGCSVEALTGYGLREFTLLVSRKGAGRPAGAALAPPTREVGPLGGETPSDPRTGRGRNGAGLRRRVARPPANRDEALCAASDAIVSPDAHTDESRLNDAFKLLRLRSPVHWVEAAGIRPFWAVTRHADVVSVERRTADFAAGPRTVLSSELVEAGLSQVAGKPQIIRSLPQMDDADHSAYRALTQPYFAPAALGRLEDWLAEWARRTVGRMAEIEGVFDFATEVATPYALRVIGRILGVSDSDHDLLSRLAGGVLGADDPGRRMAELPTDGFRLAMHGYRDYFNALCADRRRCPRDDVATVLANARIRGEPIPEYEGVSYFVVLATGGYETTALSITGGLHALIHHPDQFAYLKRNPGLVNAAVEEMLRWTSPARHFVRTATRDTEIEGTRIRAGEAVAVFFGSANRDEFAFADPGAFRVDRSPNPHVAFGRGAHVCLGQHLSRMEMRAFFGALLPRLVHVELAGPPRRARSAFVTGLTSLPIRCKLA